MLYLSLLCHVGVAFWSFSSSFSSDVGRSCARPLRGVVAASGAVSIVAGLSVAAAALALAKVRRRFVSKAEEVVREQVEDMEEGEAEQVALLSPAQREKLVSRALTDGMLHACCGALLLLLCTLAILSLAFVLLAWSVTSPSADCSEAVPTLLHRSQLLAAGLGLLLLFHLAFYVSLRTDAALCVQIHFMEQAMIKHDGKIRA